MVLSAKYLFAWMKKDKEAANRKQNIHFKTYDHV